jgi:hypothetical protein
MTLLPEAIFSCLISLSMVGFLDDHTSAGRPEWMRLVTAPAES